MRHEVFDYFLYIKPLLTPWECGDIGIIMDTEHAFFVSVVDVLGHGKQPYELAKKPEQFLIGNYTPNLFELVSSLHEHISGSIGIAGSFLQIDKNDGKFSFIGVGNVVTVFGNPVHSRMLNHDGVIGYRMPTLHPQDGYLKEGDSIFMYSDGIKEHFVLDRHVLRRLNSAQRVATHVVNTYGKSQDDKACFVLFSH